MGKTQENIKTGEVIEIIGAFDCTQTSQWRVGIASWTFDNFQAAEDDRLMYQNKQIVFCSLTHFTVLSLDHLINVIQVYGI